MYYKRCPNGDLVVQQVRPEIGKRIHQYQIREGEGMKYIYLSDHM